MSEQREALAEALADSWLVDQIDCAEVAQVLAPTVAALLADAEQRGAGRVAAAFRIAAELTVQDVRAQRGDHIVSIVEDSFAAHFDRAALTTGAADRVRAEEGETPGCACGSVCSGEPEAPACPSSPPEGSDRVRAEAQVDFSRLNYGICPKCGEDKFIGHGPWCIDCFTNRADQ